MTSKMHKLRTAAARLNRDRAAQPEAYLMRRGKIVGFDPCPRALVFLAAMCNQDDRADALRQPGLSDIDDRTVLSIVENRAYMTDCPCHPSMTMTEIMDLEYD